MTNRVNDSTRTLILTEKAALCAQLDEADVRFLLEHHRAHLELRPAGADGFYTLSPRGRVGIINTPTRRIILRSKISLQNLFLLLDSTATIVTAADPKLPKRREEIFDFLACQLALRLRRRTEPAVARDPRPSGSFVVASADSQSSPSIVPSSSSSIMARLEDLALNLPRNQLVISLAERILASGMLNSLAREMLSHSLRGFEGVTRVAPTAEAFNLLGQHPMPEGYRPLFELCHIIAEGIQPNGDSASAKVTAFLLPMTRVFEDYVTRGIRVGFAEESGAISTQPWYRLRADSRSTPVIAFCPDITIDRADRPHIYVNARWGRPPRDGLITPDVYRALATTAALGVRRSIIIYPGSKDLSWEYDIPCGPGVLEVRTLCVTGDVARCRLSLHRLGRHVYRIWAKKTTG